MNRDKHIEEMAKVMCKNYGGCSSCMFFPSCDVKSFAIRLHDTDYRKASEVAREIFEEIEKNMVSIDDIDFNRFRAIGRRTFAELKKKYTEEGK